ncbi:hypothetical protein [Rhodococcus phenolicus]|uniref:hypothetical protein n=1 Tax=Rhodococcus phenolicus TaxID=263849 RepID=UPI000A8AAFDA|nr:hypothetical protein [Rhodococcus phenolicus]
MDTSGIADLRWVLQRAGLILVFAPGREIGDASTATPDDCVRVLYRIFRDDHWLTGGLVNCFESPDSVAGRICGALSNSPATPADHTIGGSGFETEEKTGTVRSSTGPASLTGTLLRHAQRFPKTPPPTGRWRHPQGPFCVEQVWDVKAAD